MAAAASNSVSVEFKIPSEPSPVPQILSSEDDSFVVLGRSLTTTEFEGISLDENNSFGKSIMQEAKETIKEELDRMENGKSVELSEFHQPVNDTNPTEHLPSALNGNDKDSEGNIEVNMDQSTVFPAMPPQPKEVTQRITDDSRTISIVSFSPSEFASEELQLKVSQLIDENVHLKDTILQNNVSMKAQHERIVVWQKDVEKVYQAHKEKLLQAKQYIEKLQLDNSNLKQEIENVRYALKLQENQHNETKQVLVQSSENNMKEFELEIANKKIQDLESELKNIISSNEEKSKREEFKWQGMEEKLLNYERELENAYKKIKDLESQPTKSDNDLENKIIELEEKSKLQEEKLALSEMAVERGNKETQSLRSQLAKNLKIIEDSSKVMFDLCQANQKIAALETNLLHANEKALELEKVNTIIQKEVDQAKQECSNQKKILEDKNAKLQAIEREVAAYKQTAKPKNMEENAYLCQQLGQLQMVLTQCDQNRAVAYAQIEKQKSKIAELRKQLEQRLPEEDAMFVMQTQLEVYKTDFEAEREAKENVKSELNKLSEDLQLLHRRNQQLQEEIEIIRRDHGHDRSNIPPPINQKIYKCPKCQFGFHTLNAVENHVVRCIELDESLP